MPRLTKRTIDSAAPKVAPYFIWCTDPIGFGIRVFPTSRRTFYADYRTAEGQRRRMRIGDYGALTVDQARKEAQGIIGSAARGGDALGEKRTQRSSLKVRDLCANYLEAAEQGLIRGKRGTPKKASTLYVDRGRIERHIIPLLGSKLVKDLGPAEIHRFIRDVTTGKTAAVVKTEKSRGKAIVQGGAGTATRAAGLLGSILSFAVSEGIIPYSPTRGVARPADKRRTARLTPDQYRQLGAALKAAESEGELWQPIAGIRLLALTGCRLGEIVGLRWSEVDLAGSCLRLTDSKEGASVRPMGAAAVEVLRGLPRARGATWVLPAARTVGRYGGMPTAWRRIRIRAKLPVSVTPHTLRHSFASTAGDLSFSESTIGALLGHAAGTVTSRYVHHLDAVLIAAADRVTVEISQALNEIVS